MGAVVLSLGMGVDSVGILTRWLTEPETRWFDLSDLIVLTAMVGAEYRETAQHMEQYVLPLMRTNRVRYVQLSRGGQFARDRYAVLNDSTQPRHMHMTGPWTLTDYQLKIGSVPQFAHGKRDCSRKAKGEPLDWWREDHLTGDYQHVIGFSAEEGDRILRDASYTADYRSARFPLAEWGWTRQDTIGYLHEIYGCIWPRSCCVYCPFARSNADYLAERWRQEPEGAALALEMERRSLALNPRGHLFPAERALQFALDHQLTDALALCEERIRTGTWAIYDIRRIYFPKKDLTTKQPIPTKKGHAYRSVRTLTEGRRGQLIPELRRLAAEKNSTVIPDPSGVAWAHIRTPGDRYPTVQQLYALGPAGIHDKQRDSFAGVWSQLTDQTTLIAT